MLEEDASDAIIISDVHLGSGVCQAKKLTEFLTLIETNQIKTSRLIVNGDLFDSWDFRKLKKSHWKVLSHIRKISKHKHVVWINGNHDGPAEIVSHLIGVDFLEEYHLTSGLKKILILHGDKFDEFIADYPVLTKIADNLYRFIQKMDRSFYLARLAKKSSKTFMRNAEVIEKKSTAYARKNGFDLVCCGHVHLGSKNDEKGYYNSGCWVELPSSYLEVKKGEILLKYFD
jgi:UDP-2,3-diacylglucosamine pyrophosphatase LpxH